MDVKKKVTGVVISARNLIVALEAKTKTGLKLFGGITPFKDNTAKAEIPEGNFQKFYEPFLKAFGIKLEIVSWSKIDEVLIMVANWLTDTYQGKFDLTEKQLKRIALEYAVSAIFVPTYERQSFEQYLAAAVELRQAYKGYNQVAKASAASAFQKGYAHWSAIFGQALVYFGQIRILLATNPHLRVLRTKMALLPVYSERAYNVLREMEPAPREAVIRIIVRNIGVTGNPIINLTEVFCAYGEVKGNELISTGTLTGVSVEAATPALGIAIFGEDPKSMNGGGIYEAKDLPLAEIGANLAALHGFVEKATIETTGQDGIKVTMTIRDRLPKGLRGFATVVDLSSAIPAMGGFQPREALNSIAA